MKPKKITIVVKGVDRELWRKVRGISTQREWPMGFVVTTALNLFFDNIKSVDKGYYRWLNEKTENKRGKKDEEGSGGKE